MAQYPVTKGGGVFLYYYKLNIPVIFYAITCPIRTNRGKLDR